MRKKLRCVRAFGRPFFALDAERSLLYCAGMSNAKGADKAAADLQELPFEDALKRLETIVESMEAQDLPLETLLARYEEGARLTALCQNKLTEAELKIQQLEKNAKGGLTLKPLTPPEEIE
jgi:exodeoxyribonuclease VII small subunit